MDRALRIDRITDPGQGLATIEGTDPRDLAVQAARVFARYTAAQSVGFVVAMRIAGGGDGAAWRVAFLAGSVVGPNVQSSILPAAAHCRFAIARQFAELDRVAARMLAEIRDGFPNAFVVDTQIAGGGRDGAYLIGVLFSDGLNAPLMADTTATAEQEITTPTDVVSIVVPQSNSGTPADQCGVLLHWSISVEDPTPGGASVQLWDVTNGASLQHYAQVGAAGQWQCNAGTWPTVQPVGVDFTYSIRVAPVFGGTVNVRQAALIMQLTNRSYATS